MTLGSEQQRLKEQIEKILEDKHPQTVSELVRLVQEQIPNIPKEEVVSVIEDLEEEGRIQLKATTTKANTYMQYLMVRSENLWLYIVLMATLGTLIAIYVLPYIYPTVIFRWIVGSVFVLFLPGYTLVQALFPVERELDNMVRLALSAVLSIAITYIIGLLLNYTPWGMRPDPVVASISTFTLITALTGAYRRFLETTKLA